MRHAVSNPLKGTKAPRISFCQSNVRQLGSLPKKVSLPTIVCGLKAHSQCRRKPRSRYSCVGSRSTKSLRKASPRPKGRS